MQGISHAHSKGSKNWVAERGPQAVRPLPSGTNWRNGTVSPRSWPRRNGRSHVPIGEAIQSFLAALREMPDVTENTVRHYAHDLEMFRRYLVRCRPQVNGLDDVRAATILGFLRYMTEVRGNVSQSARRRLAAVRRLFAYLRTHRKIKDDPTEAIAIKAKPITRPVTLDLHECRRLLEAAKTTSFPVRDHAIFYLFLTTGCTLSELIQLRLKDVDLESGLIRFTGRRGAMRVIRLSPGCFESLQRYAKERPKAPAADRSFFLNRRAEPVTKGAVYHSFRIALKAAGIRQEGITIHSLRHTCLALLWEAGVSIQVLRKFAGHQSIASTRIYKTAAPRPPSPHPWDWVHPIDAEADAESGRAGPAP